MLIAEASAQFVSNLLGRGEAAGAIQSAVLGAILAGGTCGILGTFVTLRRMALFGDMIGHAVLPGVAFGFILAGTKDNLALVLGALAAGLLAAGATRAIVARSRLKEDAALGITLSTFYAVGVWLLSWITRRPELSSQASGLKSYLFGNPAVVQSDDLLFLAVATVLVLVLVIVFYKELLACSFDAAFAETIGLPTRAVGVVFIVVLTSVIVVSISMLGVILVAALLVIPAACAFLLTERLRSMMIVSAAVGGGSGFLGAYVDFVFRTGVGPAIVTVSFAALVAAFLGSPRHGVLARGLRHRRLAQRTVRENLVASAFRVCEREGITTPEGSSTSVPLERIARERGEDLQATRRQARTLAGSGWGEVEGDALVLTAEGETRGQRIVRGHRLWELFLQREASLAPDHVHAGAEEIEHFLNEDAIEELEELLGFPDTDPHGQSIPNANMSPSRGAES